MNKRLVSILLAAMMVLLAVPVLAQDTTSAQNQRTGTIINGPATVYDGIWTDTQVVGTLQNGTGVIVLQQFGDRVQVFARAERTVGWISLNQVNIDQNQIIYTGIVISQNVSLREGPKTNAKLIASVPNGSVFELLDEQDGWYTVRYWDPKTNTPLEGYVRVDFVVRDPSFVTTTQSTYVYSMPSRSAKKVGQLVSGTQLVVIGEYGDFWVVNLRSASGFIYKNDIEYNQIGGGNG